jgi:cytochrome c554/c'-like protein
VKKRAISHSFSLLAACGLLAFCLAVPPLLHSQLSTEDHLNDPGFWPTKPGYPRSEYVGSAVCANCHSSIYSSQVKTSMALTSMRASASNILLSIPHLSFSTGPYSYSMSMNGRAPLYEMSSPTKKLTAALAWAFGTGRVGQSYLFSPRDGTFREARVTYFSSLQNLHFTPAREFSTVNSPEEAMYREVHAGEVKLCFGCHTTASFTGERLDEDNLFLGVTCEACHGPGAKHVSTMQSVAFAGTSYSGPLQIFSPDSLAPLDAVDFCGACHATSWDVILSGVKGVSNVKSEPYRLELSKCWGKGDARLQCWSCHDPHQQIQSAPESYDHACLKCHAAPAEGPPASARTRSCPVATSACVSCHMPKVYVPEMHFYFADHKIHITHPGEPYKE